MSRRFYLESARIDRFGGMAGRSVGPFAPHLNIVFGPNEAGKSTLSAFIGGVLFGWEDARGKRNPYKPDGAERSGSLFFAARDGSFPSETDRPVEELRRVRNADGLQGDSLMLADLDKATFNTVFSFSSDELRDLKDTADVTAHLLTAGSGTGASPARALAEVDGRLAEFTSRAASAQRSLVKLAAERDELKRRLDAARAEADGYRRQYRELYDLEPKRRAVADRIEAINRRIEGLTACRASLEKLDAETQDLASELIRLNDEEQRALEACRAHEKTVGRRLARLSNAEDRAVRDKVEDLVQREVKQDHAVEAARERSHTSVAAYKAAREAQRSAPRRTSHRGMQVAVCTVLFALLLGLGIPLFLQGRNAGSLSYLSLGLVMSVFGSVLVVAAFVLAFRPSRKDAVWQERVEEAYQTMLHDEKKREVCELERDKFADSIAGELDGLGLGAAGSSLRRARALLDEASEARSSMAIERERQQRAVERARDVELRLAENAALRHEQCSAVGADDSATLSWVDEQIDLCSRERVDLLEEAEATNRRWGELTQELAQARHIRDFDLLKNKLAMVKTRIDDATRDFARLLLERKMLEEAIAAWESKSQPEVYARASKLLETMTGGRWQRVTLSDEGGVRVVDHARVVRDPLLLSLGTCQQLYLALRMALLICSPQVGASVPVIADDILVHFDAERREGAARALVELSRSRQVIVLTCHKEVVEVLERAAEQGGMEPAVVSL